MVTRATKRKLKAQSDRQKSARRHGCKNKKTYDSKFEAENYAKMYTDPRFNKDGKIYRVYLCPKCGKFHLSTKYLIKEN